MENGGNPSVVVPKVKVDVPSEISLRRSSRFKEAPQALSDGTYIVPWKNPISRSKAKKRLLEKIENLRLAKEINPSTKSKKSSRKNSKK